MKKILIAMAMMSAMAMAQSSSGAGKDQSSSSAGNPSATQSGSSSASGDTQAGAQAKPESDKAAKGGKEKTVKGCLHKDGDNYWLATKTTKYHVMSSQDLSAHDGHEVKVSGTTSKSPMPGSTDNKKVNHLEASNVEMVADKCSMGEKSMKMKGDEMEKKDSTKK
jgi:hypothetical protein